MTMTMSSISKKLKCSSPPRTRRSCHLQRRAHQQKRSHACRARRGCNGGRRTCITKSKIIDGDDDDDVSDKLEALKNLIPAGSEKNQNVVVKAAAHDQLFQETADYILLLRTQVVVLQRLIHIYGSENQNAV